MRLDAAATASARDPAMAISVRTPSTTCTAASVSLLLVLAAAAAPMVMTIAEASRSTVRSSTTAHVSQEGCLSEDEAVFPYWSYCFDGPARYSYAGGNYYLAASWQSQLAPEWDESNSTYYVRLSDTGTRYGFTHSTVEWRFGVLLNHTFFLTNLDTGRNLAWRQEGDERFLIEADFADGSLFQFSRVDIPLPCPYIYGARCAAYNILTAGSAVGLAAYVEDGVTYFKEQSDDLFIFQLLEFPRSSSGADGDAKGLNVPSHHSLH